MSQAVNQAIANLTETLQRSTVQIYSRGAGAGSGVIWRSDGLIVTNAHVVPGASAIVELADGRRFEAQVTQRDDQPRRHRSFRRDLAALRIAATDLPAVAVRYVNLGTESDELRVGDLVFAVGYPLGQVGALTMGIVHSASSQPWIQADIRLAPGNSGGPLADAQGRVVGINTMIINGVAFAIPSDAIESFLQGKRSHLGVTLQPVLVPLSSQRQFGLLVLSVATNSPAAGALQIGDLLIGVEGWPLRDANDLMQTVGTKRSGEAIRLDLLRGSNRLTQTIVLGEGEVQAA